MQKKKIHYVNGALKPTHRFHVNTFFASEMINMEVQIFEVWNVAVCITYQVWYDERRNEGRTGAPNSWITCFFFSNMGVGALPKIPNEKATK